MRACRPLPRTALPSADNDIALPRVSAMYAATESMATAKRPRITCVFLAKPPPRRSSRSIPSSSPPSVRLCAIISGCYGVDDAARGRFSRHGCSQTSGNEFQARTVRRRRAGCTRTTRTSTSDASAPGSTRLARLQDRLMPHTRTRRSRPRRDVRTSHGHPRRLSRTRSLLSQRARRSSTKITPLWR